MDKQTEKRPCKKAIFAILQKEGETPRMAAMTLDQVVKILSEVGEDCVLTRVGKPSKEFFEKLREAARREGLLHVENLDPR